MDLISVYLADIARYPLLTIEEEALLVESLRAGNEEAKQKLIQSNLRLVVTIAKQYASQRLELFDLIQEGNIGLIEAANDFVTKVGSRFKSYADNAIRNQIIDSIRTKPKVTPVSLDADETLEETVPDKKTVDPADQVVANELVDEIATKIATLPYTAAVNKVLTGYNPSELEDDLKQEYSTSLRQLAHPSRA